MQFIALLSKEQGLAYSFMLKGNLLIIYNKHLFILVILIIINIRAQSLIKVLVHDFCLFICL